MIFAICIDEKNYIYIIKTNRYAQFKMLARNLICVEKNDVDAN